MRVHRTLLPQSLVGRVFLLYSISILLFASIGLGGWAARSYHDSIVGAQDTAATLLSLLGPASTDSAVIGDYDTIGRALDQATKHEDLEGALFIDMKGGRLERNKTGTTIHSAPNWLIKAIDEQLPDISQPVTAGGKDYGVLRLRFASHRIAGELWQQGTIAAGMALLALAIGNIIVWIPLNHWLGSLDKIRLFGEQMQVAGGSLAQMPDSDAPLEFRKTFEVLNQAASSLQLERDQAAVTLSAIADGVATFNAQGVIVLVNPVLPKMLGLPSTALLGKHIHEVLPGQLEDLPRGTAWKTRVRIRTAKGSHCVLDINRSPIGADDQLSGGVMAFRDVSQAQTLEDQLKTELQARSQAMQTMHHLLQGFAADGTSSHDSAPASTDIDVLLSLVTKLMDQLHERGEQLSAIFTLSPDGFASFDDQHRVRYVSPAFIRLTGLSQEQCVGMPESALLKRMIQGASHPSLAPSFDALRQAKQTIDIERPVQRVLEMAVHTAASGAISQVLHIRDVTHEMEVDRMKSEFLSTAAHELRTPITSVYGFTELLMTRAFAPEKQKTMLERIHRQSSAMITILNELLDLSRIEARQGTDLELEPIHITSLIKEAMHDFQPPPGRTPPKLALQATDMRVHGDRSKLLQVLRNLLSNAYKYSPDGGDVLINIQPDQLGSAQAVCIECIDHGMGMTEEQCAHVTERFYRVDKSGAIPGTGLGMSIVKEIVTLHGGRLALESALGQGTCVKITLPSMVSSSLADTIETNA
jgi:PAS domain S-box-containing protein